jgi:DNA-binding MarR family transcriptional regulator/GNAT superfamily N-acetyltransferase
LLTLAFELQPTLQRPVKRAEASLDGRIAAVRRFSRFYTLKIGALAHTLLDSDFSLAQARVLYELAHASDESHTALTAGDLAVSLTIDEGYLSRILRGFERRGFVRRKPSVADRRRHLLQLTARGRRAFAPLDKRSYRQARGMLERLTDSDQARVVDALATVQRLLGAPPPLSPGFVLRTLQPGDIGWVVHRHGAIYASEYGYDERFEALVAAIAARFVQRFDPKRERCWIAERDGQIAGSVFLVSKSRTAAKLRLLLVEPAARGLGVGTRLVSECVRFAKQAGYRRVVLWTQSELDAARRIYERTGFRRVAEEAHHSFGRDLVAETWELSLQAPSSEGRQRSKRLVRAMEGKKPVAASREQGQTPGRKA